MEFLAKNEKEIALRVISNLPEEVTYEDILYSLYVNNKIYKGFEDIQLNKIISHEQVAMEIEKWQK